MKNLAPLVYGSILVISFGLTFGLLTAVLFGIEVLGGPAWSGVRCTFLTVIGQVAEWTIKEAVHGKKKGDTD